MTDMHDYHEKVIVKGDAGSTLLAKICETTVSNSPYVITAGSGMHGRYYLRIPAGFEAIVHSAAGDPRASSPESHAASMVHALVQQAKALDAKPVGFADVIDSRTGDLSLLERIARAMVAESDRHGLAILNGENAILGDRVGLANVSAMMISIRHKKAGLHPAQKAFSSRELSFPYAEFDPQGKPLFINSDGVGTKTEFYERTGMYLRALKDSLAMKLDDAARVGARPAVVMDIVETRGRIPFRQLEVEAEILGSGLGVLYILQRERVGRRICGYDNRHPAYNVSGSVVSLIDEKYLNHPPAAKEGDTIIAIHGKDNPRSNGITGKRRVMKELFGNEWHAGPPGDIILPYLAEPSIIFAPLFLELLDSGLATSVHHMSGGALNGKLARPLAKQGLYASISHLFLPNWREDFFRRAVFGRLEEWYATCPMGNDAYVTTARVDEALDIIYRHGLTGRKVGAIEKRKDKKTGVELQFSDSSTMYFSGK